MADNSKPVYLKLRDKIAAGRRTLAEVHGAPLWGVKTGLNEAFVIDAATRARVIAADPRSAGVVAASPELHADLVARLAPK